MTQHAIEPVKHMLMDDAHLRAEFRDYLLRVDSSQAPWLATVLSFEEFRTMLGRWEREYHPAWIRNDRPRMEELERALML